MEALATLDQETVASTEAFDDEPVESVQGDVEASSGDSSSEVPPAPPVAAQGQESTLDDGTVVDADHCDLVKLGFSEAQATKFKEDESKIVLNLQRVYGGSTEEHYKVGKMMHLALVLVRNTVNAAHEAKGAGAKYEADDTFRFIDRWSVIAARKAGIGTGTDKKGKEKTFNAAADVKGYLFVEKIKPLVGDTAKQIPWGCLRDHFLKLASFNAEELNVSIKGETAKSSEGWPEFIKTWMGHYFTFGKDGTEFEGWTDYRGTLKQAIEDKKAEIAEAKDGKLTAEEREAKAKADATNKKNAAKNAANKRLSEAMTNALVKLDPKTVAEIICTVAKEMQINLPITGAATAHMDMKTALPALAAAITSDEAVSLLKNLYVANKTDVLNAIALESGKLAQVKLAAVA